MKKFKFLNINKIAQLPKSPGIYCFKKGKEFLYIGKASNIRKRVRNHSQFINQVSKIGYLKTDSEIEALILEANLIKRYQPKYNIVWRDDKNYFYLGITKEDFPQVFITHQPKLKIDHVGPFVDGKALKQTLKILRKVFPYRTCNPPAGGLPKRPCLWYQLDRCPAPCLIKFKSQKSKVKSQSQKNIKNLILILKGKRKRVLINLKKEMKLASRFQDFEKAGKIRDQIISLEKVISHARIFQPIELVETRPQPQWDFKRIEAYDVSNIQGKEATGSMITFIDGKPEKSQYRKFKIKIAGKPDDIAMIKEVLKRRFKHPEWGWPDLILIDGGKAQLNAALKIVKNIKVISLSKKENKLYLKDRKKPILLKSLSREIFNLILQLRDEAHRFAISYHRKLRLRTLLGN